MRCFRVAFVLTILAVPAAAADEALFELAKKTVNPIADLAVAPLQYNWDGRIGKADDGTSNYLLSSRCCRCISIRNGT